MDGKHRLELHYYFDDESHTIDAFVRNKCEAELLAIAKEVISTYTDEEVIILSEVPEEGGYAEVLTFLSANKDAIPYLTLIVSIITLILTRRPAIHPEQLKLIRAQEELIPDQKKLIEIQTKLAESTLDINELNKEKVKLDLYKARSEEYERLAEQFAKEMDNKLPIIQRKSNFYKQLQAYPKVTKFKATAFEEDKIVGQPEIINRVDFPLYILNTNKLPKDKDDEAIIEIVSPVITSKNSMKWRGMYNDQLISFSMGDKIFRQSVASGNEKLHEGYLLKCILNFVPEIKEDGTVENKNYRVSLAKGEVTDKEIIETIQGRKHRLKKEQKQGGMSQASLFGDDDILDYKLPEIKTQFTSPSKPGLNPPKGSNLNPPQIS